MWIMIFAIAVYGGVHTGSAEFYTRTACEAAKTEFRAEVMREFAAKKIAVVCVAKRD